MENEKLVEAVNIHSVEIAKLKEQNKSQDKDIEKLQDQGEAIYKLATSVELLAQNSAITNERLEGLDCKIDKVDDKVNKLDKDLSEVKNKDDKEDAKKWNSLVKQIITIVVSVVIGIVLAKIGLQ